MGSSYTYELSCELYEYENELIDTAIDEVDNTVEDEGYITSLTLVGSAITATATPIMATGGVSQIFLNNDGSGYTSTPTVTFSAPQSGINTATAVAITTSVGNVQSIYRIEITNSGIGYTVAPTITFSGGGGTGAAATCSINQTTEFNVNRIRIDNEGKGYPTSPTIEIVGSAGAGITAIGIASVSSDGKLNSINLIRPGAGYTHCLLYTSPSPRDS